MQRHLFLATCSKEHERRVEGTQSESYLLDLPNLFPRIWRCLADSQLLKGGEWAWLWNNADEMRVLLRVGTTCAAE